MSKRSVSFFIIIALTGMTAFCAIALSPAADFSLLSQCRELFAYNGEFSAYFYGFDNSSLYSARAIPDPSLRTSDVDGVIRAVSHDESKAYALVDKDYSYYCYEMDMNSGYTSSRYIYKGNYVDTSSFCVIDGEAFVMLTDKVYSYIFGVSEYGNYQYSVNENIVEVFSNNGLAYMRTSGGSVYRIGSGTKQLAATVEPNLIYRNAGAGYIYSKQSGVYSLESSFKKTMSEQQAVISGGVYSTLSGSIVCVDDNKYEFSSPRLIASAQNQTAVLDSNYSLHLINHNGDDLIDEENSEDGYSERYLTVKNGVITDIKSGTTVAALKKAAPSVREIRSSEGEAVSSGPIKTGYIAVCDDGEFPIAVRGDLAGSAKVNKTDVDFLAKSIAEKTQLSGAVQIAADLNNDGVNDTRDLVLLMKLAEQ